MTRASDRSCPGHTLTRAVRDRMLGAWGPTGGQVPRRWIVACAGAEALGMTALAVLAAVATGGVTGALVGGALGGYVAHVATREPLRADEGGHA